MTKMLLALACAALLFAFAEARAAEPGTKPAPAAAKGEGTNPEEAKPDASKDGGSEAKPEEGAPTAESGSSEAQPEGDSGAPVSLGDLTKDGFVIRTSNFIPADAGTRQSGKVSSDALVVTLQKSTSTAICFYTLKAYVGKKLNTIPACTVHR